jgi:hypothetical protein
MSKVNGYQIFELDTVPMINNVNSKLTFEEIQQVLHIAWKNLSEDEKQYYHQRAREYNGPRIELFPDMYLSFVEINRPAVEEYNPEFTPEQVSKTLNAMWRNLSTEDKSEYYPVQRAYKKSNVTNTLNSLNAIKMLHLINNRKLKQGEVRLPKDMVSLVSKYFFGRRRKLSKRKSKRKSRKTSKKRR